MHIVYGLFSLLTPFPQQGFKYFSANLKWIIIANVNL